MDNSDQKPAALILAFRRHKNILGILESLRLGGVNRIYLSVDGPRTPEDYSLGSSIVELVENYCEEYSLELLVLRRRVNLGLSLAVLSALDWFFQLEPKGLVIEDDLIFDCDFVFFCNEALNHFEADSDVWLISGSRFDDYIVTGASNSWTNYPMIWGWATWSTRWPQIRDSIISSTLKPVNPIKLSVREYWKTGLRRVNLGILNSWAAPLAAQMKFNAKYCVLPPVNLVSNVGVDKNAEHTFVDSWHSGWNIESLPSPVVFSKYRRKEIAQETDSLFERQIYKIKKINMFSYVISISMDGFRFPKSSRAESLKNKYENLPKSNIPV